MAIIINGIKRHNKRDVVSILLTILANINDLNLVLSKIFLPCQVFIKAWPKHAEIDTDKAINNDIIEKPEYSEKEFRPSSNNLTINTLECIEPIPSPKAHPFGGEARKDTTLGLPSINNTKADSEREINIIKELIVKILRLKFNNSNNT
jgi:hypothetical protein